MPRTGPLGSKRSGYAVDTEDEMTSLLAGHVKLLVNCRAAREPPFADDYFEMLANQLVTRRGREVMQEFLADLS